MTWYLPNYLLNQQPPPRFRDIEGVLRDISFDHHYIMATTAPLVTFKKGPKRPVTTRKRSTSPSAPSEPGPSTQPTVVRPTKKSLVNPLVQGTKRRRDLGEEGGGGLDELDYRADEGLSASRGDVFATRSSDWDLENEPPAALKEKKIRLSTLR